MLAPTPHPHHRPHGERMLPFMVAATVAGVLVVGGLALTRTALTEVSALLLLVAAVAGGLIWLARLLGDERQPR